MIEFLNKGAHFSSLTGEKLSEHQVIAAVQAAQAALELAAQVVPPAPDLGRAAVLLAPGRERATSPPTQAAERLAAPGREQLRRQNVEYASKRDTRRLGPVRTVRLADGSWAEFQKRRLARSGGTVEQYKQPHLIPDLSAIDSFQVLDHMAG